MKGLDEFSYLREVAKKYGSLYIVDEINNFFNNINTQQLNELATAYELIDSRGDACKISHWIHYCFKHKHEVGYHESSFSSGVAVVLRLFGDLGEKNIPPFSSCRVGLIEEPPKKPNWDNLPAELEYLREPAERYGAYGTSQELWTFLDNATEEEMELLARTAEQIRLTHL
jgi:hypothetical protein